VTPGRSRVEVEFRVPETRPVEFSVEDGCWPGGPAEWETHTVRTTAARAESVREELFEEAARARERGLDPDVVVLDSGRYAELAAYLCEAGGLRDGGRVPDVGGAFPFGVRAVESCGEVCEALAGDAFKAVGEWP